VSDTPQAQTHGRCLKCAAMVELDETFRPGDPGGNGGGNVPRMHRLGADRKNPIGEVCGPVAMALLFHVIGHAIVNGQPSVMRFKLGALQTPEENYDGVVPMWEALIRGTFKAADPKGAMLIGVEAPIVVVASWASIGAML
jgi:hypothetical protein